MFFTIIRHSGERRNLHKKKHRIPAFAGMTAILYFLLICSPFAQDTPTPAHHPAAQVEQDRIETERRKAALEAEANKIQSEMGDTQKKLINTAKDIKKNEEKLIKLETRIQNNRAEQKKIETRLKADKNSIGDLVLALERLERTPPEAVIARPGAPLETAQSAMLLQSILPNIYGRAENLKKDLARLDTIIKELEEDQAEVKTASVELADKQKSIAALLATRKNIYAKTRSDLKEQESALREISARSDNLKDLVGKLEAYEERTQSAASTSQNAEIARAAPSMQKATPIPKSGSAQLPISGIILVGYKQFDEIGAESQGLTIQGRPKSLVVSPMGGVVRYAGSFKSYGQIIIVEHQKDYHSLIAGLARIDTVVGQSVVAGEPVGILGTSSPDGGMPNLYYELRLNGEPVNPARKFSGL